MNTAEHEVPLGAADSQHLTFGSATSGGGLEVEASILSDVGCCRQVNEDCGRYVRPGDKEVLREKGVLALVADGMGGHLAGETASRLAVEIISRVYYEDPSGAQQSLRNAFLAANSEIYRAAGEDQALKGMGTTCTALALLGGRAFSVHVGDSRLYLVRDGSIYLMSEDHSAVMEMVKQRLINLEEARRHADKNVILRALGSSHSVEVSAWDKPLGVRAGDRFVLCSDGLYDLVEDEEIKEAALTADPHVACKHLTRLAKERGGFDNITVTVLNVSEAQAAVPAPPRQTRELEARVVEGGRGRTGRPADTDAAAAE